MYQEAPEKKLLKTGRIKTFIKWDSYDEKYHGINTKFFGICENNHSVHKSYKALQSKGCKDCGILQRAKKRTIPHKEAENRILEKGIVRKIIGWDTNSNRYEGKETAFFAICTQGHSIRQRYDSHVHQNNSCEYCSRTHKPTNEEAITNINDAPTDARFVKWRTKNNLYHDYNSYLVAICSFGHKWPVRYGSIYHSNSGCPCSGA